MIAMIKLGDICEKASSNIAQKDLAGHQGKYAIYGANGLIKYVDFYQQDKPYIAIVKDGAGIGKIMKLPAETSVIGTLQYIMPSSDIDIDYLAYAMEHMNLAKYSTGSTIPHIYFKDYKNEILPLPALSEQKKIGGILDKIDKHIMKNRQQLDKLNELVKSRFIELFGIPGTDRYGWGLSALKNNCVINPQKNKDHRLATGVEVSFLPMSAVSEDGVIDTTLIKTYEEVKTGFTYFSEGDVLFAKITPCMENGKGAIAVGLKNEIGFGSTEFHVLRPISGKTDPYWLYVVTAFPEFRYAAANNMTGSAGQRRVPASYLENYRIAVPPISLQKKFASFVIQVDKSKLVIQKSLEKLEVLKKSLMQQYFG